MFRNMSDHIVQSHSDNHFCQSIVGCNITTHLLQIAKQITLVKTRLANPTSSPTAIILTVANLTVTRANMKRFSTVSHP